MQRGVASVVTNTLENLLHTEVSVGRVDVGYFNRIILDHVTVKDLDGKNLLKASRLSAKIDLSALAHGKISISSIQFYGFDINLYRKRKDESPNFQFLIDAFSGGNKPSSSPDLRINSVLIRRGKLTWNELDQPATPERFNPSHIVLDHINATLSLKHYSKDSLNLRLKKLAFDEQSGFQLKQMTFRITAGNEGAMVEGFGIELPHSRLMLSPLTLTYRRIKEASGKAKFQDVEFQGGIDESTFSAKDFTSLLPALRQAEPFASLYPVCMEARFNGTLDKVQASRLHIHTEDQSIRLEAPLTANNLRSKERLSVLTRIRDLRIENESLRTIAKNLKGKTRERLGKMLLAIGQVKGEGFVSYANKRVATDFSLRTNIGALSLSGKLTEGNRFDTDINSGNFQLGKLLTKEDKLGAAAFDLSGRGWFKRNGRPWISVNGKIHQLHYNHHDYRDISLDATYSHGGFDGKLAVNDPHITLAAEGAFSLKARTPYIKGRISVGHFAPHTLSLTRKYEGTTFQGDIEADFQGNDIEDLNGTVVIRNFAMDAPDGRYATGPVTLLATEEAGRRKLSFQSDFLQAEMTGAFKMGTLVAHGRSLLHRYLPTFIKMPQAKRDTPDEVMLSMHVNNAEPFEKILGIPLRIHEPAHLNGYLNSQTGEFDFNASIPSIEYNRQQLSRVMVMAGLLKDSIACNIYFQKQIGKAPVDFNLLAQAARDNIHARMEWTNHTEKVYRGVISAHTSFSLDEEKHTITDIRFNPSQFIVNDSAWNMHASHIHAGQGKIHIDNFKIDQADRHLILNGDVSSQDGDTLTADLKDINLEYIFNIINFHTVDFTGQATGKAYGTRLMKSPMFDARLRVENFTFNKAYLGDMAVHGGWSKEENAVFLDAHIADPSHQSTTHVEGNIRIGAPPRGGIDLLIRTQNIDLAFLNKYTEGIFTNLQGRASGWTRVSGPFKGINLEGDMFVSEASTKVDATGVKYRLANDSIILRPDRIYFRGTKVYDPLGTPGNDAHYAIVNGELRHTHLSNLNYQFDIDAYNVLGYDIKDFGDEAFCGTAYATGRIGLNGYPGNLNIHIAARPEAGTVFSYNLSSPTTLTDNQFITYKSCTDSTDASTPARITDTPVEPESDMRISFQLDLTPAATMKILMDPRAGDYIALNGHGNIRANYYNKGDFTMYGTYTVDHGVYKLSLQDVIRKDFTLNPGGTIIFGGIPTEADLNLQAVYTVPSVSLNDLSAGSTFSQNNVRVNCLMNLTGKARAPQIGFDFDLPNVNEDEKQMVRSLISTEEERNMQVIYLLGIGRFYTYDYNNTEQSQSSVAMKSLLSSTLSGQLNQMFSNILGNNSNWNIGTNLSTGEVGWSDMDVEGLLSGRLLNNRLLINGNFGYRDNATTTTSNFIGDFDVQWLLTPSGNISLKAYSKTNDRYFTKSSITTQGIGIGLKRDFDSWLDMFRMFIPKKKRKKESD